MTKKKLSTDMERLNKFTEELHKWRDRLWLGKWRFNVVLSEGAVDPENERVVARITPRPRYYHATFTVGPSLWDQSPEDQDRIALHEICHLLVTDMCAYVEDVVEELPTDQRNFACERWQEVHEKTASDLETIFWNRAPS